MRTTTTHHHHHKSWLISRRPQTCPNVTTMVVIAAVVLLIIVIMVATNMLGNNKPPQFMTSLLMLRDKVVEDETNTQGEQRVVIASFLFTNTAQPSTITNTIPPTTTTASLPPTNPSFETTLSSFSITQQKIIHGTMQPRFVRIMQRQGWGDRIKGIVNAATYALLINRAIVLDGAPDTDLSLYYATSPTDWRPVTANTILSHLGRDVKRKTVQCSNKVCTDCFIPELVKLRLSGEETTVDEIRIEANIDCSGLLVRHPLFVRDALQLGMVEDGNWRGKMFSHLLTPTPYLQNAIERVLGDGKSFPKDVPRIAMHVRVGGRYRNKTTGEMVRNYAVRGDAIQDAGMDLDRLAHRYLKCWARVAAENTLPEHEVAFLAADNEHVIQLIRAGNPNVITANVLGEIKHIDTGLSGKTNEEIQTIHLRLFTEFEMFRSADILLAAESGLSLFAYKVRRFPQQLIYDAFFDVGEKPNDLVGPNSCVWPFHRRYVVAD